ncbi:prolyl oligopeptidase family serine peptidase [Acinetobacter shaoyimingii]|uniref:S9 family peptidase n=1 Tax=Acinetobacter shaoyimingii TaxID=2715164 RepID=A0A6G8RWD2_9GAMM|nr:prolyl oligopeptidase family serine peptidase [Acinetobacter shaoyimingii]QIO06249.1 S9 family peptidase [Acinetobacter shaoyimingii]
MIDQFLYLEDIHSEKALAWVEQQNQTTKRKFVDNERFKPLYKSVEKILLNTKALPYISRKGRFVYNLWQDENNPLGVWRRTTLEDYQNDHIEWEVLIDFDQISQQENTQWFFAEAYLLQHDDQYCLVSLAKEGSDSVQVREFNLQKKIFVENGFFIDTAKTHTSWINQDEIYVMSDFGADSLTRSGYAKTVKRWKRGTALDQAHTVFEVSDEDMMASAYFDHSIGFEKHVFNRIKNFYENECFIGEQQQKLDIPLDAEVSFSRNFMLLELKSDWEIGSEYKAGGLWIIDFDDFLQGDRNFKLIIQSTKEKILSGYTYTQDYLILNILKDVCNYLEIYDIHNGLTYIDQIVSDEDYSVISIESVENDHNEVIFTVESFITPPTQYLIDLDTKQKTKLKVSQHTLDSSDYCVEQHFAESKDGTKIPYFQISKKLNTVGPKPVLMEGYGGFEVSMVPHFIEVEIHSWIDRGGVYVLTNIRGGAEYGANWHRQALKQNRHKSYEDFAAIAEDLIHRKITVKEKLAAVGGSNGGLLMGNMLTQYPQLFAAIVCEVPLLDMIRYTQIGAGHSWIAEYGDPENKDEIEILKTISPYHLLDAQKDYPKILFYTITSDDRVTPVHARKMAAKMHAMNIDNVYFYEQQQGGHSMSANKKLSAFHTALMMTFLMDEIGMEG